MSRTLVVNLFAGPGAGKSTLAAGAFSELKQRGVNAELVTEFAKDLTWEERHVGLSNQVYIMGEQHHRIHRLQGKVDVVVTDSPILLGLLYVTPDFPASYSRLLCDLFDQQLNLNYFIKRVKEYNPSGRRQSEDEAVLIDGAIHTVLNVQGVPFTTAEGSPVGIAQIVRDTLTVIGRN